MLNTNINVHSITPTQPSQPAESSSGTLSNAHPIAAEPVTTTANLPMTESNRKGAIVLKDTTPLHADKIDPASRSTTDKGTQTLALEQTKAARNLFYHPGKVAQEQLSAAAGKLGETIDEMPSDEMRHVISARLIGNEGLMRGQTILDVRAALQRVENRQGATANDRAATVELMGGIGALFADTGATTGMQSRSEKQANQLREYLAGKIPQLTKSHIDAMKELGDSSVVGPLKKQQRARPSPDVVMRIGMHDLGPKADQALGIPKEKAISGVSWQLATITKNKVDQTKEPLSGHMSGSPSEALAAFDALLGEKEPYVSSHEQTQQAMGQSKGEFVQKTAFHSKDVAEAKSARLAWATGYLVATGFHSSVEVVESALKYTGQNPRPHAYQGNADATNWLGEGGATAMIKDLHESHTASDS